MTRRACVAAAAVFLIYNLNLRAIGSRDTRVTEFVALSLGAHGDANLNEYPKLVETGLARGYVTRTPRGDALSNYPIVPALVAAPAYWVAVRTGWIDPLNPVAARVEAVGKFVASLLTAVACALVFVMLARSPFDKRRANGNAVDTRGANGVPSRTVRAEPVEARTRVVVIVVIAVALGTPLWSSASQALSTHAPAAAALAIALLAVRESRPIPRFTAGVAYGVAASCRPLLIVFLAGVCVDWLLRRRDRQVGWLAAGAALFLGAVTTYNISRFGSVLGGQAALESSAVHQQMHLVSGPWSGNLLTGLAGILASPSRGLLIYSPILVLGVAGAWRLRGDPRVVWRIIVPVTAYVIGWGKYAVWWGGHAYGPRYAADIAIPCGLLIAASWTAIDSARISTIVRGVLLAWSLAVQTVGVLCYPGGAWNAVPADVDRAHDRLWDWRDPQLLRTIKAGVYPSWWNRSP